MVGKINHPSYQGYLKEECPTLIADVLGSAGYLYHRSVFVHVSGLQARFTLVRYRKLLVLQFA